MRILVIEDDKNIADYLKKGLSASGYIVDVAQDGQSGLFQAIHHEYHLIILDVMLPLLDGFSVLKEIRNTHKPVYVILLTACDAIEDKVKGLELGADDYLVKPFSFAELLARVRAALRRGQMTHQQVLRVADLKLDLLGRKAWRGEKRIDLTTKEFLLLTLLMQRSGEVLSRTLIAELVWDINFDCDSNVVDVAIRRIRQKIEGPTCKRLVYTVRGMGYLLEERE
jgi:two-component system copper resistance phosphate regulon response regulator CusR